MIKYLTCLLLALSLFFGPMAALSPLWSETIDFLRDYERRNIDYRGQNNELDVLLDIYYYNLTSPNGPGRQLNTLGKTAETEIEKSRKAVDEFVEKNKLSPNNNSLWYRRLDYWDNELEKILAKASHDTYKPVSKLEKRLIKYNFQFQNQEFYSPEWKETGSAHVGFKPLTSDKGVVLVAFRGSDNWKNWFLAHTQGTPPFLKPKETKNGTKVHTGFYDVVKAFVEKEENIKFNLGSSSEKELISLEKLISENLAGKRQDTFIFTGHSLGGALASIYAADLVDRRISAKNIAVYSFGSPTFSDRKYDSYGINLYQRFNTNDPITIFSFLALSNYYDFCFVGKTESIRGRYPDKYMKDMYIELEEGNYTNLSLEGIILKIALLVDEFHRISKYIEALDSSGAMPSIQNYNKSILTRINGDFLITEVSPSIVDNRTLLPLTVVAKALNSEVDWEQRTGKINIKHGDDNIVLLVGSKEIYINGEVKMLDIAPQIVEDRAFVPLRVIAEGFGAKVQWDKEDRVVDIENFRLSRFLRVLEHSRDL